MSWLMRLADNRLEESIAHKMRRRRFTLFLELLESVPRPLRILDVGGSAAFWRSMGFQSSHDLSITLLNIDRLPAEPAFDVVTGDARKMNGIPDGSYDVVFSNSTIEHVGTWEDQCRAADEIRRVGKRYFVQTPNRYFPIEPHFLVPGFQFLPVVVRASLLNRMRLGWMPRAIDYDSARRTVEQIRLLTRREMVELFPGAKVHVEHFAGLAKSYVCYNGW